MSLENPQKNRDQKYYTDLVSEIRTILPKDLEIPLVIKQVIDFIEAGMPEKAVNKFKWDRDKLLFEYDFKEVIELLKNKLL